MNTQNGRRSQTAKPMAKAIVLALAVAAMATAGRAQALSADDLARRIIERRAIEAVIWGMPAVNLDLMLQAMIGSARGKPNQIVYWSRLPDWKNQTLTPNPDVIYLMPFFNTKDAGPMVLEIPPADGGVINGTVMDAWQVSLEDVGPAGARAASISSCPPTIPPPFRMVTSLCPRVLSLAQDEGNLRLRELRSLHGSSLVQRPESHIRQTGIFQHRPAQKQGSRSRRA